MKDIFERRFYFWKSIGTNNRVLGFYIEQFILGSWHLVITFLNWHVSILLKTGGRK